MSLTMYVNNFWTEPLKNSAVRREMLEGRPHLVVPAAILPNDGVVSGSGGPILYPGIENKKAVGAWNYRPIVIYHPDSGDACEKDVLDSVKVGVTLNTWCDDKLRTECWFDEKQLQSVNQAIYDLVLSGRPIEMSTGLKAEKGPAGSLNGVDYVAAALNHQPNHLAVLPDRVGAYSLADGGGIGVMNQKKLTNQARSAGLSRPVPKEWGFELKNELTFGDIQYQLCELLAAKLGEPGKSWPGYVVDLYSDRVIFRKGWDSDGLMVQYYKVATDVVSLDGEAKAVERVVKYEVQNGRSFVGRLDGCVSNQSEEEFMSFNKKAHVDSLIGKGWEEVDRVELEKLPDVQLAKIRPAEVVANSAGTGTQVAPPVTPVTPTAVPVPLNTEQYIANAPPGIREVLADSLAASNAEKARLVDEIMRIPGVQFTKEQLINAPISNVRAIHSVIPKQAGVPDYLVPLYGENAPPIPNGAHVGLTNYAGAAGALPPQNAAPQTFLPLPSTSSSQS